MSVVHVLALAMIAAIMCLLSIILPAVPVPAGAAPTLAFGFLLLSAYLLSGLLAKFRLPRITGYLLAGMLFGPSLLGLLSWNILNDLKLVDDLALTFIALAAGGELRVEMLKARCRSIVLTLLGLVLVVLIGMTGAIMALRSLFPFTVGKPFEYALVIAAICAVIAVARSPASAIAIIDETRARGPFTEMVLGVTVAADVLTIFLFAALLPFCELIISGGRIRDPLFFLGMGSEVGLSLAVGLLLGRGIDLYLEKIHAEFTIFILAVAFLVTKFSHALGTFIDTEFEVHFHLEPMLICLAAGFFVRNRSKLGHVFSKAVSRSSLPIYTIFFAISGASLQLKVLGNTWHWAVTLVALRAILIWGGTFIGGRLSADPARFQKVSGLGFLTQAGVSLGLTKIVAERFAAFGPDLAVLLVATIIINQIIGPVAFKSALAAVGETAASSTRP